MPERLALIALAVLIGNILAKVVDDRIEAARAARRRRRRLHPPE